MKNQQGQTSLEYILLVSVMISLAFVFFGKVNEYVLTNPDSMINTYLGKFTSGGIVGNYKTFNLQR
ncbi:MAG: hypothetical protein ACLGG7_08665 [Bacteriovoracia bacterium]